MFTNDLINKTSPIFRKGLIALFSIAVFGISSSVGAQETTEPAVSAEVAYILNTFLFLVCGFLVMFMAAGFCMLEAGQVRSKKYCGNLSKKYRIIFTSWSYVLSSWL